MIHPNITCCAWRLIRARANTTRENQSEAVNNGETRNCFDWRIFACFASVLNIVSVKYIIYKPSAREIRWNITPQYYPIINIQLHHIYFYEGHKWVAG